jgi:hypothetical protein
MYVNVREFPNIFFVLFCVENNFLFSRWYNDMNQICVCVCVKNFSDGASWKTTIENSKKQQKQWDDALTRIGNGTKHMRVQ